MSPDLPLAAWIDRQYLLSAHAMLRSVSATGMVKRRPGFGQTIVPKPGSIVASPELASYDPDPDYFFHWIRDSALVIDAVRLLVLDRTLGQAGIGHFRDFLRFSLALGDLCGADIFRSEHRRGVDPGFLQYLRDEADLATIEGDRILGEPRFNPDGTLDISRWGRPQADGPALRALAVLRWWPLAATADVETRSRMGRLLRLDLDFSCGAWPERSIDIWEEDLGHHYYTALVQQAALERGADWASARGDEGSAAAWRSAAAALEATLGGYWSDAQGFVVGRTGVVDGRPDKDPDIATILAILHADRDGEAHGLRDPRIQATLMRLEDWYDAAYPINRDRPAACAPALGRYPGDVYYGGGAFILGTLGAAELHYRLAAAVRDGAALPVTDENREFLRRIAGDDPVGPDALAAALVARGDMYVATVRRFTPDSGELSEQIDRSTGAQASAKSLAWSYAAFITATHWRRAALARSDQPSLT